MHAHKNREIQWSSQFKPNYNTFLTSALVALMYTRSDENLLAIVAVAVMTNDITPSVDRLLCGSCARTPTTNFTRNFL